MSQNIPEDQVFELRQLYGEGVESIVEMGLPFFYVPSLLLSEGCAPRDVDGLLCPIPKDGYSSRLYISKQVGMPNPKTWNGNVWVKNMQWHAVSWRLEGNMRLAQMLAAHLGAFR